MRKIFIFLGIVIISLVLVGCNGESAVVTPPSYTGVKIENTDPVDDTELVTFYRAKQQTLLVEVSVLNPDKLSLKSVVINGITYNSHRFSAASTSTKIYFEMNVGSTVGGIEYSVDRITYLDGNNTKTVEGFSDNEFYVYVYKSSPTVIRENFIPTKESISIDYYTTDVDTVINSGTLFARLYDELEMIEEQALTPGLKTVLFTGLESDKHYDVRVEASYDLLDGDGLQEDDVLLDGTFATKANGLPSALIDGIIISPNDIKFNVTLIDTDSVVLPDTMHAIIYKGDELLEDEEYTLDLTGSTGGLSFDGLLNDNEYTIEIIADYDLNNGEEPEDAKVISTYVFNTYPRELPEPELINMNILENSIDFTIEIDDDLNIIDKDTIIANLYLGDTMITSEISDLMFNVYVSNLFANKSFRIELKADYYLNDGDGVHVNQVIYDEEFSTLENFKPTVLIENIIDTQGYIYVDLQVNDEYDTLIGDLWAILYDNDVEVETLYFDADEIGLVFDYVTVAETNYYVEIFADYNLRDGHGADLNQSLSPNVLVPVEPKVPIAEISNVIATTTTITTISLDLDVIDGDTTIEPNSIWVYLYLGNSLTPADSKLFDPLNSTILFNTDIRSDNDYTIIVRADYDLEDGSDLLYDQEIGSYDLRTEAKNPPSSLIEVDFTTTGEVQFDVIIKNLVGVDIVAIAYLYDEDGNQVGTGITLPELININQTFSLLTSETDYSIIVKMTYDLDDGNGEITVDGEPMSIRTAPNGPPLGDITAVFATTETVSVVFNYTDVDGIANTYLNIYDEFGFVKGVEITETGEDLELVITGLDPYTDYIVLLETSYDLNDLNGLQTEILDDDIISTGTLVVVNNEIIDNDTTSLEISIDDFENILVDATSITATIRQYNEEEFTSYVISPDGITTLDFINLLSDSTYIVEFTATYDTSGTSESGIIYTHTFDTISKLVPLVTIDATSDWVSSPDLTLEITIGLDTDKSNDAWTAYVFVDGSQIASQTVDLYALNLDSNPEDTPLTVVFTGIDHTIGGTFTVVVMADIDINVYDSTDIESGFQHTAIGQRTFVDAEN